MAHNIEANLGFNGFFAVGAPRLSFAKCGKRAKCFDIKTGLEISARNYDLRLLYMK